MTSLSDHIGANLDDGYPAEPTLPPQRSTDEAAQPRIEVRAVEAAMISMQSDPSD